MHRLRDFPFFPSGGRWRSLSMFSKKTQGSKQGRGKFLIQSKTFNLYMGESSSREYGYKVH